mmetsp:Transcript_64630/g.151492  ORF Transcript_64630/g.151492 Transcript_64630/m.151492 type:complete len:358 (-) Transcript_64630:33-1106(-)
MPTFACHDGLRSDAVEQRHSGLGIVAQEACNVLVSELVCKPLGKLLVAAAHTSRVAEPAHEHWDALWRPVDEDLEAADVWRGRLGQSFLVHLAPLNAKLQRRRLMLFGVEIDLAFLWLTVLVGVIQTSHPSHLPRMPHCPDSGHVAGLEGQVQAGVAVRILRVDVGPTAAEESDDIIGSAAPLLEDGGLDDVVVVLLITADFALHSGPPIKQRLHQECVSAAGCEMNGHTGADLCLPIELRCVSEAILQMCLALIQLSQDLLLLVVQHILVEVGAPAEPVVPNEPHPSELRELVGGLLGLFGDPGERRQGHGPSRLPRFFEGCAAAFLHIVGQEGFLIGAHIRRRGHARGDARGFPR